MFQTKLKKNKLTFCSNSGWRITFWSLHLWFVCIHSCYGRLHIWCIANGWGGCTSVFSLMSKMRLLSIDWKFFITNSEKKDWFLKFFPIHFQEKWLWFVNQISNILLYLVELSLRINWRTIFGSLVSFCNVTQKLMNSYYRKSLQHSFYFYMKNLGTTRTTPLLLSEEFQFYA